MTPVWPFLHEKNLYFIKKFPDDTVFYSVRTFARIRQHYFSKYWGMDACTAPPQILGAVPPKCPPMTWRDSNQGG